MDGDEFVDAFFEFPDLTARIFQGAIVVDDEISSAALIVERYLSVDAPAGLFFADRIAAEQSSQLSRRLAMDHDEGIEHAVGACLYEKRRIIENPPMALVEGSLRAIEHRPGNSRMCDGLELCAGIVVTEYNLAKPITIQGAIVGEDVSSEGVYNFIEGRLSGLDDLSGELIGVENDDAQLGEHVGHRRFSGGDAPGETDNAARWIR